MKTVVLIEDDQFLQELYKELVGSSFILEIFGDGLSGKERLLKGGWDLALVDLTLPALSGIQVLEAVHKLKNKGKLVVLTNSEDPALITLAKKNSDEILIKSKIDPNEFVAKIQSLF